MRSMWERWFTPKLGRGARAKVDDQYPPSDPPFVILDLLPRQNHPTH